MHSASIIEGKTNVFLFPAYVNPRRRTRSLNAPSPFQQFGPCGRIMKNSAMVMWVLNHFSIEPPSNSFESLRNWCDQIQFQFVNRRQIQDPASQRLTWYKPPLAVLVIKKVRDQLVLPPFVQLVEWLIQVRNKVK